MSDFPNDTPGKATFSLRPEQQAAIDQTYHYWQQTSSPKVPTNDSTVKSSQPQTLSVDIPSTKPSPRQFLWNAKPRFGKTFAAYEFARKINAWRILIITNRPAISDAWASDFFAHVAPKTNYIFASAKPHSCSTPTTTKISPPTPAISTDILPAQALSNSRIYSRSELIRRPELLARPLVFFISLQDIKGKDLTSADFKTKNQWIFDVEKGWDLLIIDESHEGIKTAKTSAVLNQLKANFTLYLSGTPFRALADQDFSADQIFNWTYLDEQKSYRDRPRLDFRICNLSDCFASNDHQPRPLNMSSHLPLDLGGLFQTSGAQFAYPVAVQSWLDYMALIFRSQPDLHHTFWLLSKVNDCKALQIVLAQHSFFQDYKVVLAAGKMSSSAVLSNVRSAIGSRPDQAKTITLSCGRLTTGITIPEWAAVFMLYSTNDLSRLSSAQYLQTVFRAQNPNPASAQTKTKSYVFDFAPDRVLTILQDYAQSLCNLPPDRALPELLKYLTVSTLNASKNQFTLLGAVDVMELPRRLVAQEIVDGGFVFSNKLFNIHNIFHASAAAQKVINKLTALRKNRLEKSPSQLPLPTTKLDAAGQPLTNPELINQAFQEVLKNPKYRKFNSQTRQKLHNLALLETMENFALDELSPADQINFENALREVRDTASRLARRQKKREEDNYRDKLRGFSRTIPMLLHTYGEPNFTFSDLAEKIPDQIFLELTGLTKSDFALLRREQYFNEPNCDLAIREFMRREKSLANYFLPDADQDIFDFIPLQYGTRVLTPKFTAEKLLQKLEVARPGIFRSRDHKFFDPAAKSGVFLTLIIKKLYQNLRPDFPSDRDCLFHILTHQIYAWSPDEISHRIVKNTVLSFIRTNSLHFSDAEIAKISHNFLIFNPILEAQKSPRSKINYPWKENMKFDVIVSNPPYQLGRRQIYADFYRLAVDLDPELLCMIFPQGWQKPCNHNGLGQLNCTKYKRDSHIVSIDNYNQKSAEKLFPNIGTGGLNIILRDRNYDNHGSIPQLLAGCEASPLVLPLNASEISKPAELLSFIEQFKYLPKIESLGSARKPYGFYSDPLRHPEKYHLDLHETPQTPDDVRLFGLLSDGSRGYRYISRASLPKISNNIDQYKLFIPKAWGNMATNIGLGGSYSNICVASPGDVCSETFIEFGPFASQDETIKAAKYFMTQFFRALLFLAKDTQNTTKDKYCYIPLPDFSESIWQLKISELDPALFDLYNVPPATRTFISDNVQLRSEANIEIL